MLATIHYQICSVQLGSQWRVNASKACQNDTRKIMTISVSLRLICKPLIQLDPNIELTLAYHCPGSLFAGLTF